MIPYKGFEIALPLRSRQLLKVPKEDAQTIQLELRHACVIEQHGRPCLVQRVIERLACDHRTHFRTDGELRNYGHVNIVKV